MLVMDHRPVVGGGIALSAVDVVFEDRGDRAVGQAVDLDGAAAGGFETVGSIAFAQAQNAEAGTKTLLGMGLPFENGLDQAGGVRADGLGFGLQPFMGPAGIAAMSARHVLADRGVPSLLPGSKMARDPAAAMEQFDRGRGDACCDRLLDQAMGNGIIVFVDLDMIIDPDPAFLPFGVFIGLRRQGREGRFVDLMEQLEARRAEMTGWLAIEFIDQLEDASEVKRRFRSLAKTQRSTTWTPTSAFALSFGRLGLAGMTTVP